MGRGTELVFVEGHSTDDTYATIEREIARHPDRQCQLLRQTGKGKGDAVRLGFAHARGDVLMILDADLTVAPEDLPRFLNALRSGKGEFINGVRLVYPMQKQAMRFFNLLGNKFFSLAFSWLLGQSIKDTLCGTKVLSAADYQRIAAQRAYFGDFDPFGDFDLLFGAAKLNLKIVDLPIRYRERTYGTTNIQRWRHGWLLLQMVAVRRAAHQVRLAATLLPTADVSCRRRSADVQRGGQRRGAARAPGGGARSSPASTWSRWPWTMAAATRPTPRLDAAGAAAIRFCASCATRAIAGMAAALRTGIATALAEREPRLRRAGVHGRRSDPRPRRPAAPGRADRRRSRRLRAGLALRARRAHAAACRGRAGRSASSATPRCDACCGVPIGDLTSGFRAARTEVFRAISLHEHGFGIQLEGTVKAHRAGFRVAEVPITLGVRKSGYSKMAYTRSFWLGYARLIVRLWLTRAGDTDGGSPAAQRAFLGDGASRPLGERSHQRR